ncbi:DUF1839 family protein [Cupriavidus necator]|uniref:DUF1839 family protein n=1 Tax=Cupriavidus necator TaxID=106590 RepID=UPI003593C18A
MRALRRNDREQGVATTAATTAVTAAPPAADPGGYHYTRQPPCHVARPVQRWLHDETSIWQETNCYMDLWIELLYGWGLDPRAALAFTVAQDYEGDHFTFFKYPQADIELLYGTVVQEMAVYDTLQAHLVEQIGRGHTVLVEMDSYYLPDTRATAYRQAHVKTTVAIDQIDAAAQRLSYYHSLGYHTAADEDYRGLLRLTPELRDGNILFPYAECAKRVRAPLRGGAAADAAAALMRHHLGRRPALNPVTRWRADFDEHVGVILARGDGYFHQYGFNLPRQLGANFEMLHHCLAWFGEHGYDVPARVAQAAHGLAAESKVLQFRLARAMARGRPDRCSECLGTMESAYETVIAGLLSSFGAAEPAPPARA